MSQPPTMSIGELSRITGTPATTLRYYERRGLIPPPARIGGRRTYDTGVIARLMVIKFCRIAGLSLDDTDRVITDQSAGREVTKQIAGEQIDAIDAQIAELELARRMMHAVTRCDCGDVERCRCGAMDAVLAELRTRIA